MVEGRRDSNDAGCQVGSRFAAAAAVAARIDFGSGVAH